MIRRGASIAERRRTAAADARLGHVLAAVAGTVDAAGFVLAQRYTSHVTGLVAAAGDELATHAPWLALASIAAVSTFVVGSACCALFVRFARRRRLHALFAWPLLIEALLLALAAMANGPALLAGTLCFAMGWQNALATKASRTEIRTTHVTGIVTDIGIALGRVAARTVGIDAGDHADDGRRLALLAGLLAAFLFGAMAGSWTTARFGATALLMPASALLLLAAIPLQVEYRAWRRQGRSRTAANA
jgi:uncharacterized membrane protein YoaK (UPF0700 family)